MAHSMANGKEKERIPGEEEATKLLSNFPTVLNGIEMVLGRPVDAKELKTNENLRDIADPSLDGKTRYALLLMMKSMDPNEAQYHQKKD